MKNKSQKDLVKEYFTKHPNRDIKHPEVVDWVTEQWVKLTGEKFRDPDRSIRDLAQEGFLIKISKGVYRYDPDHVTHRKLEDFTQKQKEEILKRDGYRCVVCGKGRADDVELQVDHIIPKDKGGKATIENGQTLCAPHNFQKKNHDQTEMLKKMFKRLYELAKSHRDNKTKNFCADILEVYKKHNF